MMQCEKTVLRPLSVFEGKQKFALAAVTTTRLKSLSVAKGAHIRPMID